MSLPHLPSRDSPWSSNVYEANYLLRELYQRPIDILSSGNYNLHRIKQHVQNILDNAIPLLLEVEGAAADEGIPMEWIHSVAECFGNVLVELENAKATLINA